MNAVRVSRLAGIAALGGGLLLSGCLSVPLPKAEADPTRFYVLRTPAATEAFLAAQSGVGADVAATLVRLNESADAVTRLVDFLERNPNALITGRKRPE